MFNISKAVFLLLLFLLIITVNANASSIKTNLEKAVIEHSKVLEDAAVLLETMSKSERLKVAAGYITKKLLNQHKHPN